MAADSTSEKEPRAAVHLLRFEASTGYQTRDILNGCLFHNQTKAMVALKKKITDARLHGAVWYEGRLTELFRDKDTGQFIVKPGNPEIIMAFGKRPRGE